MPTTKVEPTTIFTLPAPQAIPTGEEQPVDAAQLFDEFWNLPCSENCTGEMDYTVNAWDCLAHRPDNAWSLFANRSGI